MKAQTSGVWLCVAPLLAVAILAISASAASASVVWTGGAEGALSSEWASGSAYDVNSGAGTSTTNAAWASTTRVAQVISPVAIGARAYAMTVLAADHDAYTTGAQRTELGQNNPTQSGMNREMVQGQDRWIALQLLIPADYPTTTTWAELVQFKGAGTGNGPFEVSFRNGKLSLGKSQSQTYGSTDTASVWTSPVATVRGQWIKLLLHVNWSTGADGFYELWGDLADGAGFQRLMALTPGWTLKFNASGGPVSVGPRIGIYRQAVAQDSTVYFDGFSVATTQYDAMVSAFGFPPAPTASFTATPSSGTAPLAVQFADTSTGSPTGWAWSFGDGTTSSAQNPAHTYTAAGTYTATLTASNGSGASSSATRTITVTNPPTIQRASVSILLTSTAAGTRTIVKPAGTAAGDVLVSCLTLASGSVTAAPVGWTRFAAVTGGTKVEVYGYYKVATASEPASYTWTTSVVTGSAGIARYSGARGLDGAASSAWSSASATRATVAGVTTTTTNVMLVGCMGTNSTSTGITAPSGLAQAWELGVRASELDDGLRSAPGSTGTKTWTFSTGRAWAGWLVGLRPQ